MHIAGKIFLGLGVLLLIGGGIMTIGGGSALEDARGWSVEDKSEYSGTAGTTEYTYSGEEYLVMVRDDVRCDGFTIEMTNDTGENNLKVECEDDGEKPYGHEDDPSGWYHMASISAWEYDRGEYTLYANEDFELVPLWDVLIEEGGEVVGGLMGF